MIEMIQFRRKFKCEHGTVHTEHDNSLYYAKIGNMKDKNGRIGFIFNFDRKNYYSASIAHQL